MFVRVICGYDGSNLDVRSHPECVAKLFAALRARNNRILVDGATNQRCALSSDVESMFRQQPLKIVLQHIHPESGHSRQLFDPDKL
jgi:hypothetical protein